MKNKTLQDYFEKEETLLASGDSEAMKAFIHECYRQGYTYFEQGSFHEAAEFFQYVSELDPKYPDIYYHRGVAFYKSNNKYQALLACQQAIKFDSHNKEIINLMKNVQMNLGIEVTEEETEFHRIKQVLANSSNERMTREQEMFMKLAQLLIETRIEVEKQKRESEEQRREFKEHRREVEEHTKELKVTGITDLSHILNDANSLDPQSRIYYNKLNSILKNTLHACELVGNGSLAAQTADTINSKVQIIKKVLFCGFCGIIADIPFVGIGMTVFHEYVDDMWEASIDKAVTKKMENVSKIIETKLNDINAKEIAAGTLALNFTQLRSEVILTINKTDEQNNSKIKNIFNLFIKKISISNIPKIKTALSVIGVNEDDEPVPKLALLDAALIMKYLYDNHERIIASSNSFINEINNTIILKELVKIQSGIEQNQFMALQYDLYNQIECKISPKIIKDICNKAAKGQWEDTTSYVLFTNAGIKTLLQETHIKNCLSQTELSEKQIEGFRTVAFQEIGKSVDSSKEPKNYECIKKFKETYPEIINKLIDSQIWFLFPNKKIIDICVENPQLKLQITDSLNNAKGLQGYFNPRPPLELIGGNEVEPANEVNPADEWVMVVGGSSN